MRSEILFLLYYALNNSGFRKAASERVPHGVNERSHRTDNVKVCLNRTDFMGGS